MWIAMDQGRTSRGGCRGNNAVHNRDSSVSRSAMIDCKFNDCLGYGSNFSNCEPEDFQRFCARILGRIHTPDCDREFVERQYGNSSNYLRIV